MPSTVVRRFFEGLERRDLASAVEFIDDGVYFVPAAEGGDFSTIGGFCKWWGLQISSGSELHPLQIEALDDHHVFAKLIIGHPAGGSSWEVKTLGCVCTVGDGTIEAIEMFADPERALERARCTTRVLRGDRLLEDS